MKMPAPDISGDIKQVDRWASVILGVNLVLCALAVFGQSLFYLSGAMSVSITKTFAGALFAFGILPFLTLVILPNSKKWLLTWSLHSLGLSLFVFLEAALGDRVYQADLRFETVQRYILFFGYLQLVSLAILSAPICQKIFQPRKTVGRVVGKLTSAIENAFPLPIFLPWVVVLPFVLIELWKANWSIEAYIFDLLMSRVHLAKGGATIVGGVDSLLMPFRALAASAPILGIATLLRRPAKLTTAFWALAPGFLMIAVNFFSGTRQAILFPVLAGCLFYFSRAYVSTRKALVVLAVLGSILFSVMTIQFAFRQIGFIEQVDEVLQATSADHSLADQTGSVFYHFIRSLEYSDRLPMEFGKSLLFYFTHPIPRVFWPEKPMNWIVGYTAWLGFDPLGEGDSGGDGVSMLPLFYGEMYGNFRDPGLVLGFLLLLGISCLLCKFLFPANLSHYWLLIWAMQSAPFVLAVRSMFDFLRSVYSVVGLVALIIVVGWINSRRKI